MFRSGQNLRTLNLYYSLKTQCWHQMGLSFSMWDVESASLWLLDKMRTEPHDTLVKIGTVLWGIWSARIKKIWKGKFLTPVLALAWSSKQVTEWRDVEKEK